MQSKMKTLNNKHIIVGITAGIAAYKAAILVRMLKKLGAQVQVILTPDAHHFVTPLTLSTLSELPVLTEFYDTQTGAWNNHVALGLKADCILIAPATANTLAKMASGLCDNLLMAVYLSAKCPVWVAPAMDLDMYQHPATQRNLHALQQDGINIIPVESGPLASGLIGPGRMAEPQTLVDTLVNALNPPHKTRHPKALVTAGPTYENIDSVRYIGNHASGTMGVELALQLAQNGTQVHLVLGPSNLKPKHPNLVVERVVSAQDMYQACIQKAPQQNLIIMAAAVADFKPANPSAFKIKKNSPNPNLHIKLEPNPDILLKLGELKNQYGYYLVGFALEDQNELHNAQQKLEKKNLDLIVLNSLNDPGAGFNSPTNQVTLIDLDGSIVPIKLDTKNNIARSIVSYISQK